MNEVATDQHGRPLLKGLAKKLIVLERRREFLLESLDRRTGPGGNKGRQFAEQEADALGTAIVALRYHLAVIEGLDTPISVLREVVTAYDGPPNGEAKLRAAVRRGRAVVDEFEALTRTTA
jgi:hypothetical protein